uniref:Putative secreted protein n=1 Tax=Rhipicephalus microplus TaxID=6941 RepID=A0A6G5A4J3_RHIMP
MLSSLVSFPTASFFFCAVSSSGAWNSKCTASSLKKASAGHWEPSVSPQTPRLKYTGVFVPRLERESLRQEGAENK